MDSPIDPRIAYWTRGEVELNFGDYLTDVLVRRLMIAPLVDADVYRLIGSAISNELIRRDVSGVPHQDALIAYWCCGLRSAKALDPELQRHCCFFGVRGPLTRDLLGLGADTPLGDPGLLLPLIWPSPSSPRTSGKSICIPHFSQRALGEALREKAGADLVVSPAVRSDDDLADLIADIASADFVLTGSLHGAIVACAYGRPFAFWDTGFVDIPFKWQDFAASIGMQADFVTNLADGRAAYDRDASSIRLPKLAPILGCCPFAIRPSVMLAALGLDAQIDDAAAGALRSQAQALHFEQPAGRDRLERLNARRLAYRTDVGRRAAQHSLRRTSRELRDLEALLLEPMSRLRQRAAGLEQTIDRLNPVLTFAAGATGTAFLESGWTPPNEVGPWSLYPNATLAFPAGMGWEDATSVTAAGIVFAPRIGTASGKRQVSVWLNDALVGNQLVESGPDNHAAYASLVCPIPEHMRRSGADLRLNLAVDKVGSNKALGLGEDDREIGFALMSLTFVFGEEADRRAPT